MQLSLFPLINYVKEIDAQMQMVDTFGEERKVTELRQNILKI